MGEIWAEPVGNMTWNPLNISAASGPCNLRPHHPPYPMNRTGREVSCDYFPLLLLGFRSGDPHCQRRAAGLKRKRIQTGRSLCFCSGSVAATRSFLVWVLWWWMGFSHGCWEGTCCRPIFKNTLNWHLTWTYISYCWVVPTIADDFSLSSLLESRCRIETLTLTYKNKKNKLAEIIEWVRFHFMISLLLKVYTVHQKKNKTFSWH